MTRDLPYWRLSGFYLFYYASVGIFVPFWGLYLEYLTFTPSEIGELSALLVIGRLLAPYICGWVADHSGERMRVIRFAALGSWLVFIAALYTTHYWSLAVVMFIYGFFWSAPLPQFEAVTLNHLGDRAHDYTRIRVWGSIGFIVTVIVVGYVLDEIGLARVPLIALLLTIGIWLSTLIVPNDHATHKHASREPLSNVLSSSTVIAMLVAFFLMQVGHGTYYSFYSTLKINFVRGMRIIRICKNTASGIIVVAVDHQHAKPPCAWPRQGLRKNISKNDTALRLKVISRNLGRSKSP
jgi:PPP family 3-phenylpropionic acid transporter